MSEYEMDRVWVCPDCLMGWFLLGDERADEFADRHQDVCEGEWSSEDEGY